MKIVGIMPLKLNNERLPGKNTLLLDGKPLFRHQLDITLESKCCDEVFVFCSNDSIKELLPPKSIFLKREEKLDLPTANFNQIFGAFMSEVDADIYVYIHATAPFVKKETLVECVDAVKNNGYDSAFCAVKIQDFLWQDNKPLNFDSTNLPRSQDLKPIYRETSGIYVFKKEVFSKLGRRIGEKPFIKLVSFKESIDINERADFELAKIMAGIEYDF